MKRLTAILLLLFSLTGIMIPIAQAAAFAPNHACCLRGAVHQCHGSGPSDQLSFRSQNCCDHSCCRAATTSQSANPRAQAAVIVAQVEGKLIFISHPTAPTHRLSESQSTRAPPHSNL